MKSCIPLTHGNSNLVHPRLNLPRHIRKFRDGQLEKIEAIINHLDPTTPQSFQVNQDPVGSGKTVTYITPAIATGLRTCIVTGTKQLQDQIDGEFGGEGGIVADIRGISNYYCSHRGAANCEEGRRMGCANRKSMLCSREQAHDLACRSRIVCTNYALWMLDVRIPRGGPRENLGKFDFVIFDEAHSAMDQICGGIGGELVPKDFEVLAGLGVEETPDNSTRERPKVWSRWVHKGTARVAGEVNALRKQDLSKQAVQRLLTLERIGQTLKRITRARNRDWVADLPENNHVVLQPVWPRGFLRELVGSVPNVLFTSATIPRKVLELLGIPESCVYHDYPSVFDPARSPNLILPCGSMKYRSENSTFPTLVRRLGQILRFGPPVRTVIHTASYDRAFRLRAELKAFQDRIIINARGRTKWAMDSYVRSRDGIFISPSLTTGVDLKGDLCRLNIIIKAPFANTTSRIERLRYKLDKDYYYFRAVMTIRQALGRGMREDDDWCRNVMLDTDIGWLIGSNRHHLSNDFKIQYVNTVPEVFNPIKGER